MSDLYFVRTPHGLAPNDEEGKALLRKFKLGDFVRVKISRPRNIAFHNRFMHMIGFVNDATGRFDTKEEFLEDLKFHLKHGTVRKVIDYGTGEVVAEIFTPKSISFSSLDETGFQQFVERCIQVICAKMVPEIADDVLREEVLNEIG